MNKEKKGILAIYNTFGFNVDKWEDIFKEIEIDCKWCCDNCIKIHKRETKQFIKTHSKMLIEKIEAINEEHLKNLDLDYKDIVEFRNNVYKKDLKKLFK